MNFTGWLFFKDHIRFKFCRFKVMSIHLSNRRNVLWKESLKSDGKQSTLGWTHRTQKGHYTWRWKSKCGGVKSVCFVVWWLTLCTINSIRNKCKTCVIFFHTLVFVRQNNAMSYNIFSFKLFKINYTNNRKHAIFILGNHFFGAFKLFLILMANVIINYKHYCWH